MTYRLNELGWETIRNFVRNNADSNKCMGEYFTDAEEAANCGYFHVTNCVAVVLLKDQTIHRYEVMLLLGAEHYDNVPDDAKTTHKTP